MIERRGKQGGAELRLESSRPQLLPAATAASLPQQLQAAELWDGRQRRQGCRSPGAY